MYAYFHHIEFQESSTLNCRWKMISSLHEAVNKGDEAEVVKILTVEPSIIDTPKVGQSTADEYNF